MLVLGLAVLHGGSETVLGMNGLTFGTLIVVLGFAVYLGTARLRRRVLQPGVAERIEVA